MDGLQNIQRRFDAEAAQQLRREIETLTARIDFLERCLQDAERVADTWHDLANDLMESQPAKLELTKDGQIGVVQ